MTSWEWEFFALTNQAVHLIAKYPSSISRFEEKRNEEKFTKIMEQNLLIYKKLFCFKKKKRSWLGSDGESDGEGRAPAVPTLVVDEQNHEVAEISDETPRASGRGEDGKQVGSVKVSLEGKRQTRSEF